MNMCNRLLCAVGFGSALQSVRISSDPPMKGTFSLQHEESKDDHTPHSDPQHYQSVSNVYADEARNTLQDLLTAVSPYTYEVIDEYWDEKRESYASFERLKTVLKRPSMQHAVALDNETPTDVPILARVLQGNCDDHLKLMVVKKLIELGAQVDASILLEAIKNHDAEWRKAVWGDFSNNAWYENESQVDIVKAMVKAMVDKGGKASLNSQPEGHALPPLCLAFVRNDFELVKILIKAGASIECFHQTSMLARFDPDFRNDMTLPIWSAWHLPTQPVSNDVKMQLVMYLNDHRLKVD